MDNSQDRETPDRILETQTLTRSINIVNCIEFVEKFLVDLESSSDPNRPCCHTIICHGHNSCALNLIEFIFGQKLCTRNQNDAHLIRTDIYPNLIENLDAIDLLMDPQSDDVNDLSFLKIYYLEDHKNLVDHLLKFNIANKRELLPTAMIIDNIGSYIKQIDSEPSQDETCMGPARKRFKRFLRKIDEELLTISRLCSLLIETLTYTGSKMRQNSYLIMSLDLNVFYPNDSHKQEQLLFNLNKRYFNHNLNIDDVCF